MVKTAHTRQSDDSGVRQWPILRRPAHRRIPQLGVDALGIDDSPSDAARDIPPGSGALENLLSSDSMRKTPLLASPIP